MTQTQNLVSEADTFQRENRYIVIKISDLVDATGLPMQPSIEAYMRMTDEIREGAGKSPLECVVVESDWPEYETVWRMIEARMTGNSLASAPEVGETVAEVSDIEIYGTGFMQADVTVKFLGVNGIEKGDKLYTTPQPDRTAQLEAKLAERDEEIERLQSYEQGLNEVIEWMKERGLYHDADYFGEGADFAAILTEHEKQVSACTEREIKKNKAAN